MSQHKHLLRIVLFSGLVAALGLLTTSDTMGQGFRGGGMGNPNAIFDSLAKQTGNTDVIDYSKLPKDTRDRMNMMNARLGLPPVPESGLVGREQFTVEYNRNMEVMRAKFASGGFGNRGGAPGGIERGGERGESTSGFTRGGPPSATERTDRGGPPSGFDRGAPPQQNNWQQGNYGQQPPLDMNRGRDDRDRDRDREEEVQRISVSRYGFLPKEVPSWFEELDTDRDGMVGLYEWRRAGKAIKDFTEMDLNGDLYLTADEWLRHQKLMLEKQDSESSDAWERGSASNGGTNTESRTKGGSPDRGSSNGKDRGRTSGNNPFKK